VLDAWDHTAYLYSITHNLLAFVAGALSKDSKVKTTSWLESHPFREQSAREKSGLSVTPDNFIALKSIISGLSRK
jgi:hypothetical protein